VVDLQKAKPTPVDLTKPAAPAPKAKKRLLRLPRPRPGGLTKRVTNRLPKRRKRRSKVVKLPE
jgi:hypothetical protein